MLALDATQRCYTGQNAGLQKALFCWVFRLGQATGGEGGIRRRFYPIRAYFREKLRLGRVTGYFVDYIADYFCRTPSTALKWRRSWNCAISRVRHG